jgi:23S rRNA (adenine1618-N6)-methyltransferase
VKTQKTPPKEKARLHPLNKHRTRYNFSELIAVYPDLQQYVSPNKFGDDSIDFFNADSVKTLNKALLKQHYNIDFWDIPDGYLCPPIPGRADYIHHIAELLGNSNYGKIPTGNHIKCLDIGVGANCVYPIIGNAEYGWSFIGSDIDEVALNNAKKIIENNSLSFDKLRMTGVELKLQNKPKDSFYGIITKEDRIDVSICNPPFHSSLEEAQKGTLRKLSNLKGEKVSKPALNFGGVNTELWTDGGENKFIRNMVRESKKFAESVFWFTTLVSKQSNLRSIYNALNTEGAVEVKTINMGTGNKTTRIVAWSFLTAEQQKNWRDNKWNKPISS